MKKFNEIMLPQVREVNKVETHSRTVNSYFTTIGEEGINSPEDHYEQLETLKHANEGELFVLTLSSCPGGSYSGLLAWKNALEGTQAHTVAVLEGDLASAATILPNFFDEVYVTPYTTYMCHSANLGIHRNTAANVERNAAFQAKQMERFLRESYYGLLEDGELQKVIDGVELYFNDSEIEERLQRRAELLAAEFDGECEGCEGCSGACEVDGAEAEEEEQEAPDTAVKKPSKKKAAKA